MGMEAMFSRMARRVTRSEIRELLKWTRQSGIISFGGGLPDISLFPIEELCDISQEVLRKKGYLALQYGPTPGEPELIEALVSHMASFNEPAKPEDIVVTASSQQGLDLVSLLFVDEGSPIVVELPSYIGALQAFARCGAQMHGIPLEDDGVDVRALERKLVELERGGRPARFVYVIPDFQNPAGINMSLPKRRELVRVCAERGVVIVEDSPYRELNFSGTTLPSLWTLAGGEGVILLKTFSKMLFPGMRLGWLAARGELLDKVVMLKQSVDLCASSFNQLIVAEYIRRGAMRETIRRAIACYEPKKDLMLACLEREMPGGASWSRPEGGMFLWLRLADGLSASELFERAAARGVVYVKGRQFHCDGSGDDTMRLNFSFPTRAQIEEGLVRLGTSVREMDPAAVAR
jgi:2-aminoadipate transaminase